MIPLNAQEAKDLLLHRAREIRQCERQIAHLDLLATNERARLARLRAETAALEAQADHFSAAPTQPEEIRP